MLPPSRVGPRLARGPLIDGSRRVIKSVSARKLALRAIATGARAAIKGAAENATPTTARDTAPSPSPHASGQNYVR